MAIFIPKSDIDGSALGLANKRWTKLHVSSSYVSSSYINGSEVSSGSQGLMVDGHPIMLSPFHIDSFPSIGSNQVGIRLNNLLPADGNYSLGNNKITNAAYPSNDSDLANKLYVDNSIQGIKWKNSVKASSEPDGTSYFVEFVQSQFDGGGNMTSTGTPGWVLNSGSNGETATLTFAIPKSTSTGNSGVSRINSGNWTWKSSTGGATTTVNHGTNLFDGVSNLVENDRILIKNFGDGYKGWNGIYYVESTGSANILLSPSNPVLKRAIDFNTGSEVPSAAVSVEEGTQNGDIAFVCTTDTDSIAGKNIGDFNIEFSVFGTSTSDGITIYKDTDQNNRFEVTGVLRDINDIFYNYSSGQRIDVGDGHFLVGNGKTFVTESANTARTSLGLGTGSMPTFKSLTLTDALTSSLLISAGDTIEFKDRLSGDHPISASHLSVTNDVTAGSLVSQGTITAANNITTTGGNFTTTNGSFISTNGNVTLTNGSVNAPFVTASIALSASQLLLPSLGGASDLPAGSDVVTNYLYNIGGQLYFNGGAVGGAGGASVDTMAFQNHENVNINGGNLFNDIDGTNRYLRIGVSGSNTDGTYAGTTNRSSDIRIIEGSFVYLSASNAEISGSYGQFDILSGTSADISGGTIDSTVIGGTTPAAGTFSSLTATTADINAGTIDNTVIGGTTPAAGNFSTVDIDGGTIDAADITVGSGKTLNVSAGTLTLADGQISATKVGTGTFQGHVTASYLKVTNLDAASVVITSDLTASSVDINGGVLSNVIVDESCTIQVDNADYNNLTASHMNIKDSLDFTLTGSQQSSISGSNLTVQGQSLTFNSGTFESELIASSVNIDGGTIDGTIIGGNSAARGVFSVLTSSDGILSASHVKFGGATGGDIQLKGNSSANSFVDVNFITGSKVKTSVSLEVGGTLTASVGPLDAGSPEVTFDFARNRLRNIATIETGSTGNSGDAYRYDSVTRDYLDTVITQKISVDTVTTTNVNLSTITGAVNGHSISDDDRILVTGQSTASQNGIYVKTTAHGLVRAHDLPNGARASGTTVFVTKGDFAGSAFICTSSKTADVVNTNDLTFVSAGGATNAGNGLNKDSSNNSIFVDVVEGTNNLGETSHNDRENLSFVGGKLILSSSIHTSKAKFDELTGSLVAINGGTIDNTTIGQTTAVAGKFTDVVVTNELSASNATLKFTKGEFDDLEVYGALGTGTFTDERIVNISGTLQLNRRSTDLSNKTDRLYNKGGSLYWQQTLLASESGQSDFNSLYVTGSEADGHGAFISGTLAVGPGPTNVKANIHVHDIDPAIRIQRKNNAQSSSLEFAGAGNVVGAITHASNTNDLVFETFNGATTEQILSLGSYFDSSDTRQVIFLSGSGVAAASMQPKNAADINFFVSGSTGSRGTTTKGTAVFGGDLHISGNLTVDGSSPGGGGGGSSAADDITVGDAAVTIATTAGNITLDAQGNDTDIIFKGTDGGSDTTFLTLDGSEAGAATFNSNVTVGGVLKPSAADTHSLGSTSAEWKDLYLGDDSNIFFGNDSEVTLTHDQDSGITLQMNPTSNKPTFQLLTTNAGQHVGPAIKFHHSSSSPAADDTIGFVQFYGESSTSVARQYAGIRSEIVSTTNSDEIGRLKIGVISNGSNSYDAITIEGTSTSGIATVDIVDHNGSDGGLKLGNTLVTSTAAELNLLDGGTDVASPTTTVVDADRFIINDNGTMTHVSASVLKSYIGGSTAADDISEGDAAVNITTSTGNVTVKSGPTNTLILSGTNVTMRADGTFTLAAGAGNALVTNNMGQITKLGGDTPATNEYLVWGGSRIEWSTWRGFKYNKIDSGTSSTAETGNHYSFDFATINGDYTLNLPAAIAANAGFEIRVLIKTNLSGKTLTIEPNGTETLLDIDSGGSVNNLAIDVSDTSSIGTSLLLVSDGVDQWEIL